MAPTNRTDAEDKEISISDPNIMSNASLSSDPEKYPEEENFPGEESEDVVEETPPSDNLTACLQVLGAFFLMFNSWSVSPILQSEVQV